MAVPSHPSLRDRSRIPYRIATAAASIAGVALIIAGSSRPGVPTAYYTIQSNILSATLFLGLAARELAGRARPSARRREPGAPGGSFLGVAKPGVTLAIFVTFAVYHLVLRPFLAGTDGSHVPSSPSDLLVHYAAPLMAVADWLLFDPKGRLKWWHPVAWAVLPLAYLVFALVRAELDPLPGMFPGPSRYPYFFMDADRIGWSGLVRNSALMLCGILALSWLYVGADALLARKGRQK